MSTLSVELNGDAVHSIRAPDRFTTTGPFAIEFENLGRSTHVHLHVDDELDRVVSMRETNHFIDDESRRRVHISVDDVDEEIRGKLKVVTGYGSNTRYVDVLIEPPVDDTGEAVTIDETLAKPPERTPAVPPSERAANLLDRLIDRGGLPAVILAFIAVAAGVAVAFSVDSPMLFLASGAVLAAVAGVVLSLLW